MEKTILILILMAVFYLVPELLKRRRPKTYEYPEIPDQVPLPERVPSSAPGRIRENPAVQLAEAKTDIEPPRPHIRPPETPVATVAMEEYSPWQVKLDQTTVISGIIYAEILQPPRAMRPLRPRGGRRS
ncbi:MAG: hypothetical protein P4N59_27700 [Negativicutes bacterium]|nr:hypothetical protein [Negativicutes bacterium]